MPWRDGRVSSRARSPRLTKRLGGRMSSEGSRRDSPARSWDRGLRLGVIVTAAGSGGYDFVAGSNVDDRLGRPLRAVAGEGLPLLPPLDRLPPRDRAGNGGAPARPL